MKIKADLDELKRALSFVDANVADKPQIPMLKAIKLDAKVDTLTLTASDGIAHVWQIIDAVVEQPGSVFVEGDLLSKSVLSLVGSGNVAISLKKRLSFVKDGQKRQLGVMEGDEYPDPPTTEFTTGWDQSVSSFLHKAGLVQFAASQDRTSRPELLGVNFAAKEQLVIGGDGKRMAFFENIIETDLELSSIFDLRFFQEIARSGMSGKLSIGVSDNWVRALSEDKRVAVWVRTLNGNYPTEAIALAKRVLSEPGITVTLDRKVLLNSLSLAIFYADRARHSNEDGVYVLSANKDSIWGEMIIPGIAEMKDPIPGSSEGDVNLRIQPDLVYQAINAADGDEISIKIVGNKLFFVTDPSNPGWGYIQTPMVVRDPVKAVVDKYIEPEEEEELTPEEVLPDKEEAVDTGDF